MPQGSTLGPLLFLLYINDLTNASKFFTCLFADDTCLEMNNASTTALQQTCNEELVHINNWFLANKLTANYSKASKYMLTPGKLNQSTNTNFILKMGNITLEKVNTIKYLGVIFDERFSWRNHVSYICTKLSQSVGVLSKLRYYVNIETLLQTYYSLVQSHLSYSLMSWGQQELPFSSLYESFKIELCVSYSELHAILD